jgi:hypothetical protein
MPLSSNYHAETLSDVLRSALSAAKGDLVVVGPDAAVVEELVAVASDYDGDPPTVRVVAADGVLKSVVDDFLVASNAADLVESGHLSLRTTDEEAPNTLLVSEGGVVALVFAGDRVAGLSAEDPAFVAAAYEEYRDAWERATDFALRTPPLSTIRETLASEIGDTVRADFDAVLDSLDSAAGDGLDEVTVSLLVAAKNDVLLYDISKWGEDVGIASKATFSRTKTQLEDCGLLDTEKVPIDVGRPRLRLKLGDDELVGASAAELARVARSTLSESS